MTACLRGEHRKAETLLSMIYMVKALLGTKHCLARASAPTHGQIKHDGAENVHGVVSCCDGVVVENRGWFNIDGSWHAMIRIEFSRWLSGEFAAS
jgi:hypothetical protein